MIIRSIWCNWNDCFQSFNAGCCSCQWQSAIVRRASHSNFSSCPIRFDLFISVRFCKASSTAIQPIYNCLGCKRFIVTSNCWATLRQTSSRWRWMNYNKTARHPCIYLSIRNNWSLPSRFNFRCNSPFWRRSLQFMSNIVKKMSSSCSTGKIWAWFINDR